MVVDSTDHKRIPTVRDELFKLLECEVSSAATAFHFISFHFLVNLNAMKSVETKDQ